MNLHRLDLVSLALLLGARDFSALDASARALVEHLALGPTP